MTIPRPGWSVGSIHCTSKKRLIDARRPYRVQWEPGFLPAGVRRPERVAHTSTPCWTKFMNDWSYTSTSPYALMTWAEVALPVTGASVTQ